MSSYKFYCHTWKDISPGSILSGTEIINNKNTLNVTITMIDNKTYRIELPNESIGKKYWINAWWHATDFNPLLPVNLKNCSIGQRYNTYTVDDLYTGVLPNYSPGTKVFTIDGIMTGASFDIEFKFNPATTTTHGIAIHQVDNNFSPIADV